MADIRYIGPTISTQNYWEDRNGYRQKPFVLPKELEYSRFVRTTTASSAWGGASVPKAGSNINGSRMPEVIGSVRSGSFPNWAAVIYSRLYNKMLGKISERASLLTALAEYRSTSVMVGNRLLQLFKAARALRKGRFREFLKVLNASPLPRHRRTRWTRPRDFSSLWLEYWFGWAPTIGDIANAIDVLQGEIPGERVRVSSGGRNMSFDSSRVAPLPFPRYVHGVKFSYIMQLRATITVTNHNLWLANQLGFVNPVRTAWELVPFSWFADWFTNLGQVLGSFTDTVGIKVSDVWLTRYVFGSSEELLIQSSSGYSRSQSFFGVKREKRGSLPRPELVLRVPGLPWTRGATLSALLVQLFSPSASRR